LCRAIVLEKENWDVGSPSLCGDGIDAADDVLGFKRRRVGAEKPDLHVDDQNGEMI
jgi:hypothetical protein